MALRGTKPLIPRARIYRAFVAALKSFVRPGPGCDPDGEGATKFVTVTVQGARKPSEALLAAKAIAHSPLVKTAIFGADPNWGRILTAVGYSGAAVDEFKAKVSIGGYVLYDGKPRKGCRALG